jgi:hypothetical protein
MLKLQLLTVETVIILIMPSIFLHRGMLEARFWYLVIGHSTTILLDPVILSFVIDEGALQSKI